MKRLLFSLAGFGSLLACASIVGLDSSDLPSDETTGTSSSSGNGEIHTKEGITIKPAELGLSPSGCGQPVPGSVTVVNDSDDVQHYEATVPDNDVFTVTKGGSGDIKAHDAATVTVQGIGTKPGTQGVELKIKTKSSVQTVSVSLVVQGASLTASPPTVDFGFVRKNQTSASITVTFTNNGNVPIDVPELTGDESRSNFTLPPPFPVPANGGSVTREFTMNQGEIGAVTANVMPAIPPEKLCGAAPPALVLKGERVDRKVIASPASADFADIACNAGSTATKPIAISNTGGTAHFTTNALTHFKVTPSEGDIGALSGSTPGTVNLAVSLLSAGDRPGSVNEKLTLHITGEEPHDYDVALSVRAVGAVVTFSEETFSLNSGSNHSINVTNTGNADVCLGFDNTDNSHFSVSGPFYPLGGFSQGSLKVSYGSSSGPYSTSITARPAVFGFCDLAGGNPVMCKPSPVLTVNGN